MNNLDLLKQELKAQKLAIEGKGGTVRVANMNPSPSEITQGISTIEAPNLTDATATENDVLVGKTFYAGNNSKKIGTFDVEKLIYGAFLYNTASASSTDAINFTFKQGETNVREYAFWKNANHLVLTFNNEMEEIEQYAFQNCTNLEITNFSTLESLKTIGNYSFTYDECMHSYMSALPPKLETIGIRAFGDVVLDGDSIIIPETVTSIGSMAFARNSVRKQLNYIKFPTNYSAALPSNCLQLLSFNCDIRLPENSTEIQNGFNYRGSFNNVVVPANYRTLKDNCFGALSSDAVSNFHMRTLTFESETPPTFGKNTIATQHLTNGLKIYVPDTAVEYYKSVNNFTNYANYIYPISQKD